MKTFPSNLPTHARFVLMTMRSVANGSVVSIGHHEIAERTGMSPRTVFTAIHTLIREGCIEVEKPSRRGMATTYRITHQPEGVAA